jgi:DNA-directed RNA polymerase subunit N (RpoN/RPB10)
MVEIRVYSCGKKNRLRNEARLERNKKIAAAWLKYRKRLTEIEKETT